MQRTVVLRKNKVEIHGKSMLIIMVNDITDKVLLAREHIKKKKEKDRTFMVQKNLNEAF